MPRYLTDKDIADFRAELCKVATERFAKHGYEGVTMRQLAEALGCSPKTPYCYFKDKADILATVRAEAFTKFADALEKAAQSAPALERGRRTGEAYLAFALKNPHLRSSLAEFLLNLLPPDGVATTEHIFNTHPVMLQKLVPTLLDLYVNCEDGRGMYYQKVRAHATTVAAPLDRAPDVVRFISLTHRYTSHALLRRF